MYSKYEELLNERGLSNYRVAKDTGITQTTLSDWKKGKITPKTDTLQKLANYFNVCVDWLLGNTDFRNLQSPTSIDGVAKSYEFTSRDKRDIATSMDYLLGQLDNFQEALMFDGEALDDETRELLKASLENSLKIGKMLAKQKYTPKSKK